MGAVAISPTSTRPDGSTWAAHLGRYDLRRRRSRTPHAAPAPTAAGRQRERSSGSTGADQRLSAVNVIPTATQHRVAVDPSLLQCDRLRLRGATLVRKRSRTHFPPNLPVGQRLIPGIVRRIFAEHRGQGCSDFETLGVADQSPPAAVQFLPPRAACSRRAASCMCLYSTPQT